MSYSTSPKLDQEDDLSLESRPTKKLKYSEWIYAIIPELNKELNANFEEEDLCVIKLIEKDDHFNAIVSLNNIEYFIKCYNDKEIALHEYNIGKELSRRYNLDPYIIRSFAYTETETNGITIFNYRELVTLKDMKPESLTDKHFVDGMKDILHIYERIWEENGEFEHKDIHGHQILYSKDIKRFYLCDFAHSKMKFNDFRLKTNGTISTRPIEDELIAILTLFCVKISDKLQSLFLNTIIKIGRNKLSKTQISSQF